MPEHKEPFKVRLTEGLRRFAESLRPQETVRSDSYRHAGVVMTSLEGTARKDRATGLWGAEVDKYRLIFTEFGPGWADARGVTAAKDLTPLEVIRFFKENITARKLADIAEVSEDQVHCLPGNMAKHPDFKPLLASTNEASTPR